MQNSMALFVVAGQHDVRYLHDFLWACMPSLAEASVSHCSIADGHKYGVLGPFVPSLRLAQAQSCMVHRPVWQSGPNEVEPVS
jgi:hypothetical protein